MVKGKEHILVCFLLVVPGYITAQKDTTVSACCGNPHLQAWKEQFPVEDLCSVADTFTITKDQPKYYNKVPHTQKTPQRGGGYLEHSHKYLQFDPNNPDGYYIIKTPLKKKSIHQPTAWEGVMRKGKECGKWVQRNLNNGTISRVRYFQCGKEVWYMAYNAEGNIQLAVKNPKDKRTKEMYRANEEGELKLYQINQHLNK